MNHFEGAGEASFNIFSTMNETLRVSLILADCDFLFLCAGIILIKFTGFDLTISASPAPRQVL